MVTTDYRWRGHERDSIEVLRLEHGRARSEVSFGSWSWRYEIELDDWITKRVSVGTLALEHGDDGWTVDGASRPDLAEAVDVDIVLTPFTNTLPIRRLPLHIGHTADITVASIDVETLDVQPDHQRYTRLDRHR